MRIELDFAVDKDDFDSFEDFVKQVRQWERSASKNRRFSGVKVVKVEEENDSNGYPTVTFEGSEQALRKLFNYYCGMSNREQKDYDDSFEAMIVSEAESDGWDEDEVIHDSGLFDFVNRFEKFSYALRHNTRASAKWGDTNKDLAEYCNELGDELKEIASDIDETIGESKKEKLNEIDYGENNTRRKHFKAADRKAKYWIYASDTDLSHINYFVKINWETKKPYLAPVKTLDNNARTDLRPFMTENPAKIHAVALMVSKVFPKFWFNIQDEAYRETTLSRFNNTARPAGTGIVWDPKLGTWTGDIDKKLPPPEKISKKDDLFRDKNEKEASNKYEKMDPRKLPYEKTRLEKEIARTEKTVEDIKKSGNKSGKQEKFEKDLENLKAELAQVEQLLDSGK